MRHIKVSLYANVNPRDDESAKRKLSVAASQETGRGLAADFANPLIKDAAHLKLLGLGIPLDKS